MMKKMKVISVIAFFIFSLGCATSVAVRVTKPAEVNMSGARNIALFDFSYPSPGIQLNNQKDIIKFLFAQAFDKNAKDDSIEKQIADYTSNKLVSALVNANYFNVLSPKDVTQAMIGADNTNLGASDIGLMLGADAVIVGSIDRMDSQELTYVNTVLEYDKVTKKFVEVEKDWVERDVIIQITYRVIDVNDGRMYASKTIEQKRTDDLEYENYLQLKTFDTLYKSGADTIIAQIARQIAPYVVTEYRYLKKDKMKDDRMKQADEFVKGGIYEKAMDLFMAIWSDSSNPAAGYNAAIMLEVIGDIDGAIDMMETVMDAYPEADIMREYNRLKTTKSQMEAVAEQMK